MNRWTALVLCASLALVLAGARQCSDQPRQYPVCEPGQSQACSCVEERWGAQHCNSEGTRWSHCDCHEGFAGS